MIKTTICVLIPHRERHVFVGCACELRISLAVWLSSLSSTGKSDLRSLVEVLMSLGTTEKKVPSINHTKFCEQYGTYIISRK